MSESLEEFWIFSKEGEPLVNFYRDPNAKGLFNYRDTLFSQDKLIEIKNLILTNLQNSSLNKKKIMRFKNDIIRYGQYLQNDLIMLYKTNPKIKEKKVLSICKVISEIFDNAYPLDKLQFWEGNLSFFEKLRKKVAIYFKMSRL